MLCYAQQLNAVEREVSSTAALFRVRIRCALAELAVGKRGLLGASLYMLAVLVTFAGAGSNAAWQAPKISQEKFTIPITHNSGAEFTVPELQPRPPPESNEPFPNTHSLVFKDRNLDRFGFASLGVITPVGGTSALEGRARAAGARAGVRLGSASGFAHGLFSTLSAQPRAEAAAHPPAMLPSARLPHPTARTADSLTLFGVDVPIAATDAQPTAGDQRTVLQR